MKSMLRTGKMTMANVPVAHGVDHTTPVSVNTFQTTVMPNTVGSQLVELLRVAMQSTQDISGAPADWFHESMSRPHPADADAFRAEQPC
ncbi:hypothetical protein EJ110_NYTH17015 [Nymphaea thermarum]|nr:hypothetical protein EJ110_NYTH17015 [Nymphaea thermarum]